MESRSALPYARSLPTPQPIYVLRGHSAPIHVTRFLRANLRLLTGDAEGWIVLWDVVSKRPASVWRAHGNAILGAAPWGSDRIITHGRDNRLYVWQLGWSDEASMSTILPVNDPEAHRKPPWLLHALDVNTLNFCSFSMCYHHSLPGVSDEEILRTNEGPPPILIAVPNAINSDSIDILQFTQGNRISTVPADKSTKTGMLMALRLLYRAGQLTVVAGYEGGHVSVYQRGVGDVWRKTYSCQPHSQPVLSLDVAYSNEWFITSSADATIVKHPLLPESSIGIEAQPLQVMQTKHSGQQGVQVRSDSKVFATAGWDARVRVYSSKTMKELAVLKWHQDGCYAIAFAAVATSSVQMDERKNEDASEEGIQNQVSTSEQSLLGGVERRRSEKAQSTHWLAAGSKDGKVSLWDIY